jgi:hypothetical protein
LCDAWHEGHASEVVEEDGGEPEVDFTNILQAASCQFTFDKKLQTQIESFKAKLRKSVLNKNDAK